MPSLRPSNASRDRLPFVVASDGRQREYAICAGRPHLHGSPRWVTPSWGPLARPRLTPAWRALRTVPLHLRLVHVLSCPCCICQRISLRGSGQNAASHPSSCRLRMIAATAQCLQGMARVSDDFSLLEERRSKLLLASVPLGLGTAADVAMRLTLWEECRFEDHLWRAGEQLYPSQGKRKKRDAQPDPFAHADRARRTAAGSACRKAITGLVQSLFSSRAENITDLQDVLRRVHANNGLSALFCRISAGSLPPAARWLTRTRLCWQRKKNGKLRPIKMGELLRSANAKRLVNQHQVIPRSKVVRMHQWSMSLPRACEGL